MNFLWTTLIVSNMEASVDFYTKIAGLQVENRFKTDDQKEIAFLIDGSSETKLELICDENIKELKGGDDCVLGFKTDSLKNMIDFVKNENITIASDIITVGSGLSFFYVIEPDGRKVQFVEFP